MKQMLVRNVDDQIAERFKKRAQAEGKSAEQAMRDLMAEYANPSREEALRALDEIRATTSAEKALDPVKTIREDRDSDHGRL